MHLTAGHALDETASSVGVGEAAGLEPGLPSGAPVDATAAVTNGPIGPVWRSHRRLR